MIIKENNQAPKIKKVPEIKRFCTKKQRSRVKSELEVIFNSFSHWQQRLVESFFKLRTKYEVILPSHKELGAWVGRERETVCRFMQVLKSYNLITWVRRFKTTNIYRINPIFSNISIINTFKYIFPSLVLFVGINLSSKPDVTQYNENINKFFHNRVNILESLALHGSVGSKFKPNLFDIKNSTMGDGVPLEVERLIKEIDGEWEVPYESGYRNEEGSVMNVNVIPKFIDNVCLNLTLAGKIRLCPYPESIIIKANESLIRNKSNTKKPYEYLLRVCDNLCAKGNIEPNYAARDLIWDSARLAEDSPMVDPIVPFKKQSVLWSSPVDGTQTVERIGFGEKDGTKVYGRDNTSAVEHISRADNSAKSQKGQGLKTSLEEAMSIVEDYQGPRKKYRSLGQAKIALNGFTPEIRDYCRARILSDITGIEYTGQMLNIPVMDKDEFRTEADIRKAVNFVGARGLTSNPYLKDVLTLMIHQAHPDVQKNIAAEMFDTLVQAEVDTFEDNVDLEGTILTEPRLMSDIVDSIEMDMGQSQYDANIAFEELEPVIEDIVLDAPPIDQAFDDRDDLELNYDMEIM